ncbi:MAG: hypothetical protein ABI591_13900 [Kofleriaceae bacterium]
MRWLVVLAMLSGTAAAEKIVIMEPIVAAACPNATTWPAVLDCFEQHGLAATIVATLDDAKMVAVTANDPTHELEGFGLYVRPDSKPESKKDRDTWRLGGLLQENGNLADFELVRIEHLGKHGFRFDVAASQPSSASIDGVTSTPSIYRQVLASFCSGDNYRCMQLIPRCEQIVRGQTIIAFDGAITVHDNIASLKGAGSVPACSASAESSF